MQSVHISFTWPCLLEIIEHILQGQIQFGHYRKAVIHPFELFLQAFILLPVEML